MLTKEKKRSVRKIAQAKISMVACEMCGATNNLQHAGMEKAQADWWMAEPKVGRVTTEKDQRRKRLMELGNAQVPLQAAAAFSILWQIMTEARK